MSKLIRSLLFMSMFHFVVLSGILPTETMNFKVRYLMNLLNYYEDFDKIYHIDQHTRNEVGDVLHKFGVDNFHRVMIYNHDHKKPTVRPLGGRILNLVLMKNITHMDNYLSDYSNINGKDIVLIITRMKRIGSVLPDNLNLKHRHAFGKFLILNVRRDKIEMHHICHYCGPFENRVFLIQSTNESDVRVSSNILLANIFNNFYGHTFTVLFNQYFPYMHCLKYKHVKHSNITFNRCLKWVGSEGDLLVALSELMNFKYKLLALTEYITVPTMLPYLENHMNVDFAIGGIGISAERLKKLLFTRLIHFEPILLMYKIHIGWRDRLFAFLNVFQVSLWCLLISTSLILSITLFIFFRILYRKKGLFTLLEAVQVPFRVIIEQSIITKCLLKKLRIPVLLLQLSWMFGCIEVTTVYKSNLASRVIHPPIETSRNILELIGKGYEIGFEENNYKIPYSHLFNISKSEMVDLKKKFFTITELCRGIPMVLEGKIALAGEYSFLHHHCQQHALRRYDYSHDVSFAPEPMSLVAHGWLFRKEAPFINAFNRRILMIQDSGLLDKWSRDALRTKVKFRRTNTKNKKRVNLTDFTSHFTLLCLGHTIAITVFIIEVIYHKYFVNKNENKLFVKRTMKKMK